jgi:HEAT repeat protein
MRGSVRKSFVAGTLCIFAACGCTQQAKEAPSHVAARNLTKWEAALKSPDTKVRVDALVHLGNAGSVSPESAFPLVVGALKDPDPGVRKEAIRNLSKFETKTTEAVAALTQVKDNDEDPKIRTNAQEMIQYIQKKQGGKGK